jgi:signal transduction histidine kinase
MKDAESIAFELEIDDTQPFCSDKLSLITVLVNLISNAIKFCNSFICINASINADNLNQTMADNGIGISPEHHT